MTLKLPIDKQTKIPESDVRAALDAAIVILAQTSQEHAREIGGYIRKAFRPNPELVPIGVAIMFHQGSQELEGLMAKAIYPPVMANLANNMVLGELRKLPGVDEIFVRFEEQQG
jgi:hypothetical protein